MSKKVRFTMTLNIEALETLSGLLDGCMGTSDSDDFNEDIRPIIRKIDNAIKKYYAKNKIKEACHKNKSLKETK